MKKFALKLLFVSIPFLVVIITYIATDPFRTLYHHNNYYDSSKKNQWYKNKDYVSTETFLDNYDKYTYDSYIFGSSRSDVYLVEEWNKHIGPASCFHYCANRESLFGAERKVAFLHSKGVKIKHALFVFDHELLAVTSNFSEPMFRKHPLISGESRLKYQLQEFKPYVFLFFNRSYLNWLFRGRNYPWHYDLAANEEHWWIGQEAAIARNQDSFYRARTKAFYNRPASVQYSEQVIKGDQVKMLNNIKQVLDAEGCDYRIVINPLYDQKKIDSTDLRILRSIFGDNRVFDFSGINDMTGNIYNYYEASHFRTHIATRIMDSIYKGNDNAGSLTN